MKILAYNELDTSGIKPQYQKLVRMLERDDFYSAEVKRLAPGEYYRARLDHSNRLLFTIRRFNGERYALILEVIRNHEYEKSRFLRGARIDEDKLGPPSAVPIEAEEIPTLTYVNPGAVSFHLLDKVISFDEMQAAAYHLPPPLIIIGSAGSGKTALTLEKIKQVEGDVLYVTLSPFLAQNARNLYYAHGYQNEAQNLDFLSFREFLETIKVPEGREIGYGAFREWFRRHSQQARFTDAHALFEEFRGVLTGPAGDAPHLSRDEYLALGVRQSIFLGENRPRVYELFEKYLAYLKERHLYDTNILAHQYLALCRPRYDFAVVDEVQDVTNIQLSLILRSLRRPEQFILCGDANQIVHPNFFSWASVKTLFYQSRDVDSPHAMHILHTNYRNAAAVTAIANRLLKIKQRRFGSIDRESNYLVQSVAANPGMVEVLPNRDSVKKDLNHKTRRSTRFAVLVMREEHKAEARQHFDTPLLFSVQEAKGLEYENVILYNFIASDRAQFGAIIEGVSAADLDEDLHYARAKDKTDKSLEVYKFFINSFYVALTRAVHNLYLIEGDITHPLLGLLGIEGAREHADVVAQSSSLEDWQREARRLELQGKHEQAEAIRTSILHTQSVPWEVMTGERLLETLAKACDPKSVSNKPKQLLFEYGIFYDEPSLFDHLARQRFEQARYAQRLAPAVLKKHLAPFEGKHFKDVLRQVDTYGVDFRNPFNHTPLMLASRTGNVALVEALMARGADLELSDNYGRNALHLALLRAYADPGFAAGPLAELYELLAPSSISLKADERLIKIDRHTMEFFLIQSMLALFKGKLNYSDPFFAPSGFATADFVEPLESFPEAVLRAERRRRPYISSVLARNEIDRDYAYNRKLFLRLRHGYYGFNPQLELRIREDWVKIYEHLGQRLLAEYAGPRVRVFFERVQGQTSRRPPSGATSPRIQHRVGR